MSLPFQGNQYFTGVQTVAPSSTQRLGANILTAGQVNFAVATSAPTTSTVGVNGQTILVNVAGAYKLWVCKGESANAGVYTWVGIALT